MLKKFITNLFFLTTVYSNLQASNEDLNINKLLNAYPNFLKSFQNNKFKFHDNSEMYYDDNINKSTYEELLNKPSLKDQMSMPYLKVIDIEHYEPKKNEDSGRIRNEEFFKKIYGANIYDIKNNLVKIKWMPKSTNKSLWVTKINDVDKKFELVSKELDELPSELKKFVDNPSGGFNYRKIANTNRLSTHSYGIALDINVDNSDYWNWDKKIEYKNKIPLEIVKIFEKHGFIWGGRWYHYDTMHFEYRPELLN